MNYIDEYDIGINKPEVSQEILDSWQKIVDSLSNIADVPAALIMHVLPDKIEVASSSKQRSENNPYEVKASEHLGCGLYCETVMKEKAELYVKNSLEDEHWKNNPDIDLGMISYYGKPILWPDNTVFGTMCILDNKDLVPSGVVKELLSVYRTAVENGLKILEQNHLQKQLLQTEIEKQTSKIKKQKSELEVLNKRLAQRVETEVKNLKMSKERFQSLVENINDWVWEVDSQGLYSYVSPNIIDVLGFTQEEMLGKSPFALMPPEEAKRVEKSFIECVIKKEPIVRLENTNIHKDGSHVILETSGRPIIDKNGELLGYRGTDRDITERKKYEQELKKQELLLLSQSRMAAVGEMTAMIAHQWRQPLASISAICATLKLDIGMDAYNESFFEERLGDISSLSQHLSSTIDDFRNFFKQEQVQESIDIDDLVNQSLKIIEPVLVGSNITVHKAFKCAVSITTYPAELKQVILNILKNADDALKEQLITEPQIWIESRIEKEKVLLSIKDNAGGVPDELLTQIFQPYFSTKLQKDGTGLGLYMSKTIIESHCNGILSVHNDEMGAVFEIMLPLSE